MNLLIENEVIEEIEYGSNFAYVLKDNSIFLSTEYKVLQNQTDSDFVKCMKMLYNGKIELYYLVDAYKPLAMLLPKLDSDSFLTIVRNLLTEIIAVKNNGFLSCHNIDSSFEHIYVDPNTLKVGLVYLPLSKHEYGDPYSFESALRSSLIRIISGISSLYSPKTEQLKADLQNGKFSIEEICNRLGGKINPGRSDNPPSASPGGGANPPAQGPMKLVALNAPTRVEIQITKGNFIIGRKGTNDGVVSFNQMISGVHCKVSWNGQRYEIRDLQSTNGTYVNGVRLQPNVPSSVKNGDVVRLANSDFQVVIG